MWAQGWDEVQLSHTVLNENGKQIVSGRSKLRIDTLSGEKVENLVRQLMHQ